MTRSQAIRELKRYQAIILKRKISLEYEKFAMNRIAELRQNYNL